MKRIRLYHLMIGIALAALAFGGYRAYLTIFPPDSITHFESLEVGIFGFVFPYPSPGFWIISIGVLAVMAGVLAGSVWFLMMVARRLNAWSRS